MGINVLSLFDGMGSGRIALSRNKIKIKKYYASEIDKYAIKIAQKNYPDIVQLGDIGKWTSWSIEPPDLIIGGSPCQGFSFAGKGLNFDDPRSQLFFTFIDVLKYYNPKYFLLENVKMKKEYQDIISSYIGIEPIEINSDLLSGQRRPRLYWSNIPNIHQPANKNISIGDVTEAKEIPTNIENLLANKDIETKQKFSLESSTLRRIIKNLVNPTDKARCLTASMWKGMAANGMTNIYDGEIVRPITPSECERLQTVPTNYTDCVSNTQRYKMLGNGWTVDVIAHIFKGLLHENL